MRGVACACAAVGQRVRGRAILWDQAAGGAKELGICCWCVLPTVGGCQRLWALQTRTVGFVSVIKMAPCSQHLRSLQSSTACKRVCSQIRDAPGRSVVRVALAVGSRRRAQYTAARGKPAAELCSSEGYLSQNAWACSYKRQETHGEQHRASHLSFARGVKAELTAYFQVARCSDVSNALLGQ